MCTRACRRTCSATRSTWSKRLVENMWPLNSVFRYRGWLGGPQREAEIVHGEDVFEQLGIVEVADAAGLPRIVERVRQRVGARVEIVIVRRFVDAHAPQHDGRDGSSRAGSCGPRCPPRDPARPCRRCAASRGSLRAPAARPRRRHREMPATADSATCARCCTSAPSAAPGIARLHARGHGAADVGNV